MRESGYYDKHGTEYKTGQRVRLCLRDSSVSKHYIYGTIVYGLYPIGRDEWDVQYNTIGFAIAYSDGSGTTGLTPEWEVVNEDEFQRYLIHIHKNIMNIPTKKECE